MASFDRALLAFDTILVRQSGGGFNEISVDAFLELPVHERIALLMEKRIQFLRAGKPVPLYEASASLEAARLASI